MLTPRVAAILALGALLAYLVAAAQTTSPPQADDRFHFDAASLKPSAQFGGGAGNTAKGKVIGDPGERRPGLPSGGPGTSDPSRIHYPFMTLKSLLLTAYDVQSFQLVGPDWMGTERFDIDATMPPSTTREQFRSMLRNLLSERFQMTVHHETRELAGYALVVAKNGPKLKQAAATETEASEVDPPLQLGSDHYFVPPPRPGIFFQMSRFPGARSTFQQQTMASLAYALQGQLKRPVVDETGLTAKYDFVLTYSMEGLDVGSGRIPVSPGQQETPPELFTALPTQLGLRLESKKAPAEIVVIDRVEKTPKEN